MHFYCFNIFAIVISYSSALVEEGYMTFDFDFNPAENDGQTVYKVRFDNLTVKVARKPTIFFYHSEIKIVKIGKTMLGCKQIFYKNE